MASKSAAGPTGDDGAKAKAWLDRLGSATTTAMLTDGRKKIHYTFEDGTEMVEEYDVRTDDILVRKWRRKTSLGASTPFEFEIGDAPRPSLASDSTLLAASSSNPIFIRQDEQQHFVWRIRNLPYPLETYSLSVDDDGQIVLRTSNKKYFKRFVAQDLERLGLVPEQKKLTMAHANNTLIIKYPKPEEVLKLQRIMKAKRDAMKASKDGDVDCAPS